MREWRGVCRGLSGHGSERVGKGLRQGVAQDGSSFFGLDDLNEFVSRANEVSLSSTYMVRVVLTKTECE
jgi:hypothetical protein